MIKVSVIIPIYGVERFIERCAESLMHQSLEEVEFIFINDATKDQSMAVLDKVIKRYPQKKDYCQIITHEINKGLPAARNTGLTVAKGEYIFHCDSDDFVEPDMLECLYHEAITQKADIVWCDWFLSYQTSERYMKQPSYATSLEALKAMMGGAMKYNVWNKLAKRQLYTENHITFPDGYGMGEDMTTMMLFAHAKRVTYLPKAFYHYVQTNTTSFCQTYSERHLNDLKFNINRITTFIHHKYGNSLDTELGFLKLEAKFPFLISDGSNGRYNLWKSWYPEANRFILRNKHISTRSRLLQWLAAREQFWAVKLYHFIFMKVIYNMLYR